MATSGSQERGEESETVSRKQPRVCTVADSRQLSSVDVPAKQRGSIARSLVAESPAAVRGDSNHTITQASAIFHPHCPVARWTQSQRAGMAWEAVRGGDLEGFWAEVGR